MDRSVLDPDEISRRIKAARELRGVSQDQLGEMLEADGLGVKDVGRIERGTMMMSRAQRESITRHLRLPERWLLSESVDEIVGVDLDAGQLRERLAELEEQVRLTRSELAADAAEVLRQIESAQQTIRESLRPPQS